MMTVNDVFSLQNCCCVQESSHTFMLHLEKKEKLL